MLALHICCLTTLVGRVVIAIGELDITNFDKNEDLAREYDVEKK